MTIFYNVQKCFDNQPITVSSTTVYAVSDVVLLDSYGVGTVRDYLRCATVIETDLPDPGISGLGAILSLESDCNSCLTNRTGFIVLRNCNNFGPSYNVDYSSFTSFNGTPPLSNQFYYVQGQYSDEIIDSCFTINQSKERPEFNMSYVSINQGVDCVECKAGTPKIWFSGTDCDTQVQIYFSADTQISLPITIIYQSSEGISCASITFNGDTEPSSLYIDDAIVFKGNCEECTDVAPKKVIIYECLNPENYEIIYAAQLYELGDITNVSNQGTCFTVGSETTSAVTITDFLSFSPSPSCEECLQCSSFYATIRNCNGDDALYDIQLSQYVTPGDIINLRGVCYEVINIYSTGFTTTYKVYSFPVFLKSCEECNNTQNTYDFWFATGCTDGNEFYVLTNTGFSENDVVKLNYGYSNYICVSLVSLEDYPVPIEFNLVDIWYSETETPFLDCDECNKQSKINVTIIDCDQTDEYLATISLELYNLLTTEYGIFSIGAKCYYILNDCPLINEHTNYSQDALFLNCTDCKTPLRIGDEYEMCVTDCSGNTYTIQVEHPIWTRPDGKSIELLDAVKLSGINGYYS